MPALTVDPAVSGLTVNGNGRVSDSGEPGLQPNSALSVTASVLNSSIPADKHNDDPFIDNDASNSVLQQQMRELNTQTLIKEGAEKLLQMPIGEDLRQKVQSELEIAKNRINDLTKSIETQSTRPHRKRGDSESFKIKMFGQPVNEPPKKKDGYEDRDDFRTSMQQATAYIKTLNSLNRPGTLSPATIASSSSTSPSASQHADVSRTRIDTMNQLTGVLQRNLRVRYDINVSEVVQAILPALSDRSTKQCRATAYRLIRHLLVDPRSVETVREQHLDWYIVKSLARDNKHIVEKEQVIKLIRAMVEIGSEKRSPHAVGSGTVPLSEAIMRAVIAIAEQPEDPLKPICIQTLTEILLIDVELVARTEGMRVLLHAMGEGPLEMASLLASAFLYIADSPKTRIYLHPGTDLEMALSGVTDAYGRGPEHADRMRGTTRIISSMLRTWSGLMYFCIHDKLAIRALIDGLRIPSLETRDIILDMFFDLLNIKPPDWHQAFIAGRRLTMYRKAQQPTEAGKASEASAKAQDSLKLTDQYIALLLLVFSKAGLIDALTGMLEETQVGSNLSRKATLLMAEILQTANRVLPNSIASRIQALPQVFHLAANYDKDASRIIGTSALAAIDSYNRHRTRSQPATSFKGNRSRANSVEEAVKRGQRQMEQTKIKMGMQMDDKTFQGSLLESQVMVTKDHTKWNFDTLHDLLEGPLLNPKRMEEAIKVSRHIRRLMQFYHPQSHRFSELPRNKTNARWVKLGCMLLNALLSSNEGQRFLAEDEFLPQLVQSFAQLDPFSGAPVPDPVFSKKRMQETLTYGYFEMLGTLSKRPEGLALLEKFKLFTAFYHLSDLRSREDIIKAIIDNLDYSIDGHSRIVLSKALTSSYKHIRLYATNHLGELVRASTIANSWTLRLLLTQLYDPSLEVQEVAVRYLEEACEDPAVLQIVVEMHPTLDHLGEVGHPLLLKFMSTTLGFRYLYAADYIDREMDLWFHERNIHYVIHIEVFLAKVFNVIPSSSEDDHDFMAFDGIVPPHFYGVMAKTDEGSQVLQDKGHFAEFASFIRRHGLESEDQDVILKLKSVLWAVGNIGATERGLPLLEEEEVIPEILTIAERSLVLSVRGTCFFVLGLISSTPQGAEILDDYHWEATLSPLGLPTGLCVPLDVDSFVSIPSWDPVCIDDGGRSRLEPPKTDEEVEVMTAIYNLANTVIANNASRSLAKMKPRPEYRPIFASPSMLFRALHTISSQRYRLPVRRYILDLFNVDLDEDVVGKLVECEQELRLPPPKELEANDSLKSPVEDQEQDQDRRSEASPTSPTSNGDHEHHDNPEHATESHSSSSPPTSPSLPNPHSHSQPQTQSQTQKQTNRQTLTSINSHILSPSTRAIHGRQTISESDDEYNSDEESVLDEDIAVERVRERENGGRSGRRRRPMVMSLRPVSRIVGFGGEESDAN
ncbi:hypothetical protein K474DRAFT_1666532 [Panus rudis PR-1116 ss-1]|nr:hypothetical protein K474DRAFT_1666532 [Panus rudis PR-1116 ss-1]